MNTFQFIHLLYIIFGQKNPNVAKIQKMGLLALKITQHFALRVDLLDEERCKKLQVVFSKSFKEISTSYETIPKSILDVITVESPEPFASASVADVFKGSFNKKTVVLKVKKDDHLKQFQGDMRTVRRFSRLILFIYPKLKKVFNPLFVLDEIEQYTLEELDFRNELIGQDLLKHYAKQGGDFNLDRLVFHTIYPLTTKDILVSEFIDGTSFEDLLNEHKLSYDTLIDFFRIHCFFLFGVGTFHGDIHPGNIFLTNKNKIILIDTGSISRIDNSIKEGLFDFFETLCTYDYKKPQKDLKICQQ